MECLIDKNKCSLPNYIFKMKCHYFSNLAVDE